MKSLLALSGWMDRVSERIDRSTESHMELEAFQLNSQKAHERLSGKVEEIAEHMANLTILVDRLIERDLGR